MSDPLGRYRTPLRPGAFRSLRVRLTAVVFAILVVFAVCQHWYTNRELSSAYTEAGRSEILAIARTFVDDLEQRDLDD